MQTSTDIEKLFKEILKKPLTRKDNFYKFGQEYLLPLKGRALEEAVHSMWLYFCEHHKEWKGTFTIPELYWRGTNKVEPSTLFYTIKEHFMWSVLYPKEVDNFFKVDKNGHIEPIGDQKIRIVSKEVKHIQSRDDQGRITYKDIKPALTDKLESGFTIDQKNSIINTSLVGLLAEVKAFKTEKTTEAKEAPTKKPRAKRTPKKKEDSAVDENSA